MSEVNHDMLSPQAAAKHLGIGRTTVMNAIKDRYLIAVRGNNGRWKIALNDLMAWHEARPTTTYKSDNASSNDTGNATATMQLYKELGAAEATIEELRSRIADNDRRHEAEIERLERIIERLSTPSPSLIQRIFGASSRS